MAKITLVDDDENIVTSVSLALESHGHTVKAYYDGAAGLAALENDPPDLAILAMASARLGRTSAARDYLDRLKHMTSSAAYQSNLEIRELLGEAEALVTGSGR